MNTLDYIIIAILGISVLVGLWRGLISEVLALLTWIAAFWVAWVFGPGVSTHFERWISVASVRLLVGYGICFIAVLILGGLVRFFIQRLLESTGLDGTDRILGMIFGLARGLLLVALLVFLLSFTALVRDPLWQQSVLLPQFQGLVAWLDKELPQDVREHLHPISLPAHMPHVLPGVTPASAASSLFSPSAPSPAAAATTYKQ
jgi:membrane protein required for colicin V production